LIAEMLSLSGGERFPPVDLSPQRKKERTLASAAAAAAGAGTAAAGIDDLRGPALDRSELA
jgi:hypothetical protein